MSTKEIRLPDIGDASNVDVIEVAIKPGQTIEQEDTLVTLETDKASMDVPAPFGGKIESVEVKQGDKVSEGDLIAMVSVAQSEADQAEEKEKEPSESSASLSDASEEEDSAQDTTETTVQKKYALPDLGTDSAVSVIEWLVEPGDTFQKEDPLLTLETDKASMEVPAPFEGKLLKQLVKPGDSVHSGQTAAEIEVHEKSAPKKPAKQETAKSATPTQSAKKEPSEPKEKRPSTAKAQVPSTSSQVHAGPSVRRLANVLGVDLAQVQGTGRKQRILASDVHQFVKQTLKQGGRAGGGIEPIPAVDFSQWGEVKSKPLNRIKKLTAKNLHRNWVNIPHVTHFDEADITELEDFRQDNKAAAKDMGISLTPLAFIMKAVVSSLTAFPQFNSSLSPDGQELIYKHYFHIGVAVDTPDGLVVPVIRDVDQKGVFALAKELGEMSQKAREGKLKMQDMQGGCFSISSLGGIGGQAFTPIINAPEVAILGVSKSSLKPVYEQAVWVPKLMLPLALSYDHRVIDGAEAARFVKHLGAQLEDIRKLLL